MKKSSSIGLTSGLSFTNAKNQYSCLQASSHQVPSPSDATKCGIVQARRAGHGEGVRRCPLQNNSPSSRNLHRARLTKSSSGATRSWAVRSLQGSASCLLAFELQGASFCASLDVWLRLETGNGQYIWWPLSFLRSAFLPCASSTAKPCIGIEAALSLPKASSMAARIIGVASPNSAIRVIMCKSMKHG